MENVTGPSLLPDKAKRDKVNFIIAQFFVGMFTASTLYSSAYLIELGLSSMQVGIFTAIRSIFGIITPFLWGMAADRFRTVKKVFLCCLLGVLFFYPTLPLTRFIPLGALTLAPVMTIIVHFFYRPLDYIYTSWLVQMVPKLPNMEYGKMRIFSSVASALTGIIFAFLIKKFASVSVSYYGGGIVAIVLMFLIRPLPDVEPASNQRVRLRDMQLGRLLKGPILVLFLFITFAYIPSCSITICIPYLLKVIGADTSILAWYNVIRPLCAIPMMFLSGRLIRKFGARKILTFSVFVIGLGELAFFTANSTVAILSNGLILGLASGLMSVSQVLYAQELAPPELRSTVQMLNSTSLALSAIIVSALVGNLIKTTGAGVRTYYLVSAAIVSTAVVLFVTFNRLWTKKSQKMTP